MSLDLPVLKAGWTLRYLETPGNKEICKYFIAPLMENFQKDNRQKQLLERAESFWIKLLSNFRPLNTSIFHTSKEFCEGQSS